MTHVIILKITHTIGSILYFIHLIGILCSTHKDFTYLMMAKEASMSQI